jgi:hypothetical protein
LTISVWLAYLSLKQKADALLQVTAS